MDFFYFIAAIGAAFFFYWLRTNHRAVYGLSEVLVGVAILAIRFLVPGPGFLTLDEQGSFLYEPLATLISLFTGIYAIVRGLDNITTTLREPYGP